MITIKAKLFSSIKDRGIGLIGKKKAEPALFYTRLGIHTIGMSFPIDVLVLDKNNKVAKLKENLKPNSLFFWPIKYDAVLELPAGFIKSLRLEVGSKIDLKLV